MIIRNKTLGIIKIINTDIEETEKILLVDEFLTEIFQYGVGIGERNYMLDTIKDYKNKLSLYNDKLNAHE